jgi:DNA-binding transcriptional ArsR family regulator
MTQNERVSDSSLDADAWSIGADAAAPHPNELFRALNDRTRRQLLYLLCHQSTVTVDTLVEMIVSLRRSGTQPVPAEEYRQLNTALEHVHLPLLVDTGLVHYDRTAGTIELTSVAQPVETIIEYANRYEQCHSNHRQ